MKYLFFDVECSNCLNAVGKICEFGYVLCDENLNIIRADDIPMSPGKGRASRFILTGRKGEKDLELAYSYDYYFEQPEFPFFYDRIKKLMEDPNTICFAYSMHNDISHVYNTCKRYGLEPINYTCYDVQKMAMDFLEMKKQISLHNAVHRIVGYNAAVPMQEHLSRDDAKMERLVVEAIAILTKNTPASLIAESDYAKTNSVEYTKRLEKRKQARKAKSAGHELFKSMLSSYEEMDKPENLGKRYIVSGELKTDLASLKVALEIIKSKQGIFTNFISKSDYFIVKDEDNKKEILEQLKYPYEGQMLTVNELLTSLANDK